MYVLFEEAPAIREFACAGRHFLRAILLAIPNPNPLHGIRDLLAVCTHILDRRGTDTAGDSAHAFKATQARAHRLLDERIPVFSGLGAHHAARIDFATFERNAHDEPFNSFVRDHDIGTAG